MGRDEIIDRTFVAEPSDLDPDKFVVATYYVDADFSTLKAGEQIAIEESIGTWTDVSTAREDVKRLAGRVFEHPQGNEGVIKIAYPLELFDVDSGIPNLLSIVAGNLFGLAPLRSVKLLDIELPRAYVKSFPGPRHGIEGIRGIIGTLKDRRPHVGTIIKPKVGLNPKQTAEVAYQAAVGGVDLVKDDETLTNQPFCPLEERVSRVIEKLDQATAETGRKILYATNVSAYHEKMMKLAQTAMNNGANCLMIDFLTAGFSGLQALSSESSFNVPIHVHRTMHGVFDRNPKQGIAMIVLAKLVRLAGGDQLHTGAAAGKMEDAGKAVKDVNDFLRSEWNGLRTVLPVASGGIHPGIVPDNVQALGKDILIQAGGGIHGHPQGTKAGAGAMRQAVEAVMSKITLEVYAKSHKELALALEKWDRRYGKEAD
ncbi:MAG: RuBisCO large subunit C-terminal-like domain-containing protein [Promethearchaeati archaeon SRVP18_Atabeyarchaeia-1]